MHARKAALGLAAVSAIGTAVAIAPAASAATQAPGRVVIAADDGTVTCRGGELTWNASPGISFTSGDTTQTINAQGSLNACTSSKYPNLTSGVITYRAAGKGVCPTGVQDGTGTAYIQWDNGESSTAQGTFRANATEIGVFNARITSGLFKGSQANLNAHNTTNWAACLWGVGTGTGVYDNATVTPLVAGNSSSNTGVAASSAPSDNG